ncbi:AAA+ family ATPase [Tropicimonas sp.]|uniref:AAA+ family ATPase n=1 Tax=Tropicimonas sp. TaxID=2067044 RepID=UPI003A84A28B
MIRIVPLSLAAALAIAPFSATAQDEGAPSDMQDGFSLIDQGAKLLLRGLQQQVQPMMEEMATEMEPQLRAFAEQLMPLMQNFSELVGDLDNYEAPERLPNGDIILRRKKPVDPEVPPEEGPAEPGMAPAESTGEIEL